MKTRRWITWLGVSALAVFLMSAPAMAQVSTGTVNARQSGTWNITNISGTISLPTGAATSAKQPALGTAGTAASDVITVQGIASMTPILVTSNLTQVNGVTMLTGAGNTGTGSLRVTIATDQATLPTTAGALTTLVTGQQAVTGTVAVLPTATAKRVCIRVLIGGTQTVYFGPTGTTTGTGQELSPGDAWCGPVDNVNKIFVIAATTGSTVSYDALN